MTDARRPIRLLIASDKFKGSLSGPETCAAIADGFRDALGDSVEISIAPIADGGEGMARGITEARGGEWVTATVADPLGRPVESGFGLITDDVNGQRIGVIEMAEASGLWRLASDELDPWRASTFGTGELMRQAIEQHGATRLLLGIGGSATNDGGTGMALALGFRFLDASGEAVEDLPARLNNVTRIVAPERSLPSVEVACDVTNPLLGPNGCTRVYGPQKGVVESEFERHEARLAHLVTLIGEKGHAAAIEPGSGAAGGLGFGCLALLDASLRPGFELVAEVLGLEAAVRDADLVITGEGKLDSQTLQGKAPAGIAALARDLGKPVAALAGIIAEGADAALSERFDFFAALAAEDLSVEESMQRAAPLLRDTARRHADAIVALAKRAAT